MLAKLAIRVMTHQLTASAVGCLPHDPIQMRKFEPPRLRTDILVFTEMDTDANSRVAENIARLNSLGCSERLRSSFEEPSMCRLLPYTPILARNPHTDSVARDLHDYHYAESTQIVAEYPSTHFKSAANMHLCLLDKSVFTRRLRFLSLRDSIVDCKIVYNRYDVVFRSDLDAFLLPDWSHWVPKRRDTMYTGKGGFIQGEEKHGLQTLRRLSFAAARMGLKEPTVINPSVAHHTPIFCAAQASHSSTMAYAGMHNPRGNQKQMRDGRRRHEFTAGNH